MKTKDEIVPLPLDQATQAWLMRLAAEREQETGERIHPAEVAAWMLSQIRLDDEAAHGENETKH
jgi:hypothetical protein